MSVSVGVGWFSDPDRDPALAAFLKAELSLVNRVLSCAGLPPHQEPTEYTDPVFDVLIGRPSCFWMLRRVAASLALGSGLPKPVDDYDASDIIFQRYEAACDVKPYPNRPQQLSFALDETAPALETVEVRGFTHLIWHSDYCGYYVPVSFDSVICIPEEWESEASGPWLGSAPSLLKECETLAGALGYPRGWDVEALRAVYGTKPTAPGQRYAVEAFTCQALIRACAESIRSGCALVFC